MKRVLSVLVVVLSSFSVTAMSADMDLKLTVSEVGGVARQAEPACGGVPLPWGQFKKDQPFTVMSGGKAVPAQVLPHVVDEKGFLRWVLIDTQVDVPASGKVELTLKTGKSSAKPAKALKANLSDKGVVVDTGAI